MTDEEKIAYVSDMTGEKTSATVSLYLNIAKSLILQRRYPYGNGSEALEPRFDYTQINIAVYLLNKRGAEGETRHTENNIDRTYDSADVPDDMLRNVLPLCSVVAPAASEEETDETSEA